jgi:hypothetical protein
MKLQILVGRTSALQLIRSFRFTLRAKAVATRMRIRSESKSCRIAPKWAAPKTAALAQRAPASTRQRQTTGELIKRAGPKCFDRAPLFSVALTSRRLGHCVPLVGNKRMLQSATKGGFPKAPGNANAHQRNIYADGQRVRVERTGMSECVLAAHHHLQQHAATKQLNELCGRKVFYAELHT